MSKVRGMGGWWVLDQAPALGTGNERVRTVVHNASYEVMLGVDVRETRSSGARGWLEGLPRYRKIEYAKFTVAEDDASYPDVIGFTEGKELDFFLKRGELGQYDFVCGGLVLSVRKRNDQQRARWVDVVVKYGRYLRNVQSPEATKFKGSLCRPQRAGTDTDTDAGGHTAGHVGGIADGIVGVLIDLSGQGAQYDQQQQLLQSQGSQQPTQ